MTEEPRLAPVTPLFPGADQTDEDAPLRTDEFDGDRKSWCSHQKVRLDTEARRLYCRDCEREVPAFDYLLDLANDWERWVRARMEAERRARIAEESLGDLERREKNARSRVKRWEGKSPPLDDDLLRGVMAAMRTLYVRVIGPPQMSREGAGKNIEWTTRRVEKLFEAVERERAEQE